jgi:hypothetical protein
MGQIATAIEGRVAMVDRLQKRQSARLCGVVIGWLRSACRCRARGRERRAAA